MIHWTNEDIDCILKRLDDMELPFGRSYTFVRENGMIKKIGRGGFAHVYEMCRRSSGKKSYALKILGFTDMHTDSGAQEDEVTVQKNMSVTDYKVNDTVVKIYNHIELWLVFDESDNLIAVEKEKSEDLPKNSIKLLFVLMEKLTPVIRRSPMGNPEIIPEKLALGDEEEIIRIACDIGTALKAAHDKKVLHRDVKLENVFYNEKKKEYKLGDFGIAKQTTDGFAETRAFTRGYAAPEVRGTPENDRYNYTADIYSFGMMLYVLANKLRFPDSNSYNVISEAQYKTGYVLPVPDNENISPDFYAVLAKACMYDPGDRYQSMDEMMADIEILMYPEKMRYKVQHKNRILAAGNALLVLGVILWKLTLAPRMEIMLSFPEYLFLVGGVGKCVLKLMKKKHGFVSFGMLCIGLYLFFTHGFSWLMLILMLVTIFSGGISSSYICGGVLLANLLSVMQKATGTYIEVNAGYSWIAVALLSISIILLYDYGLLLIMDSRKYFYKMYTKKLYRIIWVCGYVSCLFIDISKGYCESLLLNVIGAELTYMFMNINLFLVGVTGLLFFTFWIMRDKLSGERKKNGRKEKQKKETKM